MVPAETHPQKFWSIQKTYTRTKAFTNKTMLFKPCNNTLRLKTININDWIKLKYFFFILIGKTFSPGRPQLPQHQCVPDITASFGDLSFHCKLFQKEQHEIKLQLQIKLQWKLCSVRIPVFRPSPDIKIWPEPSHGAPCLEGFHIPSSFVGCLCIFCCHCAWVSSAYDFLYMALI